MRTILIPTLLILLAFSPLAAQKATISGYIEDADSGEELISATVFDAHSGSGAVANVYGFYSLTLAVGDTLALEVSYIGYAPKRYAFILRGDTTLNVRLSASVELETVEVTGSKIEKIEQSVQMSKVEVPVEMIKKMPALLGEVDVLKAIQLLPGVQSGGEGQNGLYVRGGSPDQNLILLDGVPVYNVSHLLGFFSVFNADAIKNVTLTKGGFPARYGGRLSSVIEINMKEGNDREYHGQGSVGLIASRLTLEGPIAKDRASFMVSGRRTYVDLLMRPIIAAAQPEGISFKPKLYFYDLNAKVNYKINDKHRLFLSSYMGSDIFYFKSKEDFEGDDYFATENGVDWGNITTALRWNYQINNRLFANTTLTYSQFAFDFSAAFESRIEGQKETFGARYDSGIHDWAGKVDFDYIPNPNHYLRFGGGATHHTYNPGVTQLEVGFNELQLDTIVGSEKISSIEYALYAEDDLRWGALRANIGLHAAAFQVLGDEPEQYFSLQPRINLRYLLPGDVALKGSFATMTQFINLLTNESLSLPTDLWVPSTKRILPQRSWQAALGGAKTFGEGYEVSLEAYYKQMKNVLSYREGAEFLGLENDWQDKVTQGDGEAYGLEFFIQKKQGKTTGWIGYTLAWNWRQFDDINGGRRYPFKYDRRHDVEIVLSHQLTKNISISGTWVYGTGNAITLPLYRYVTLISEKYGSGSEFAYLREVEAIGDKNSFRMKPYHRLDLGIEFFKQKKKWSRTWVISVYNVYNRKNPYYVYPATTDGGKRVFKQVSLFSIIPSVAYNFEF
ncbi:MAG: TonB-dependent receptor plug domain-containing protein [Lewinellaceae bacterium]|nr:TonB-dependent receptor plug domain-containing protein [Lewinellaceae bacterium]